MAKKIKELYYWCAYIDLYRTCNKKASYFWRFSEEIGQKNLKMIRSSSMFFSIISVFVIISSLTYFKDIALFELYIFVFFLELIIAIMCTLLLKRGASPIMCNIATSLFFLQMLSFGGYIGVVFSPNESATVFVTVLVISPMIFAIPPILSSALATLSTVVTLFASYFVKESYWFLSDVINCVGVLILSILLGWFVNKIRAEEAFARAQVLELNEELRQSSITDHLTGLPNHWSFHDIYYKMFKDAYDNGTKIGIIMMDLDNFKSYNDNYGHVMGDICLKSIAKVFVNFSSDSISIYRYGGEEFIAILDSSACGDALQTAEEIRKSVENLAIPHEFSDAKDIVTVSLGVYVSTPSIHQTPLHFVNLADKAMYLSKKKGRNQTAIATR